MHSSFWTAALASPQGQHPLLLCRERVTAFSQKDGCPDRIEDACPSISAGKRLHHVEFISAVGGVHHCRRVPLDQDVEWYVHHLEEGHVDPSLRIMDGSWSHGDVWEEWTECVHGYTLVWKDMDLEECGSKFIDFVQDHGMPVDEPVDIMVVMLSSQRANYDWMLS